MPLGPFSKWAPPSGSFIPPSEATAEWRIMAELTSPVGKQWVEPPPPLGGWAKLREWTTVGDPPELVVTLPKGTRLRVEPLSLTLCRATTGSGMVLNLPKDILEPAEPPPTRWERLMAEPVV